MFCCLPAGRNRRSRRPRGRWSQLKDESWTSTSPSKRWHIFCQRNESFDKVGFIKVVQGKFLFLHIFVDLAVTPWTFSYQIYCSDLQIWEHNNRSHMAITQTIKQHWVSLSFTLLFKRQRQTFQLLPNCVLQPSRTVLTNYIYCTFIL